MVFEIRDLVASSGTEGSPAPNLLVAFQLRSVTALPSCGASAPGGDRDPLELIAANVRRIAAVQAAETSRSTYTALTGPDDTAFCERAERLLNLGWELGGPPSITFDGVSIVAAQAIVKTVPGEYAGLVHLDELHPRA